MFSHMQGYISSTINTLQRRVRVTSNDYALVGGVAWSPNSKYLALSATYIHAVAIDEFTGHSLVPVLRITDTLYSGAEHLVWSPDGVYLAVAFSGQSGQPGGIDIYEFTGSDLVRKVRAAQWSNLREVIWSPDGRYLAVGDAYLDPYIVEFTGNDIVIKARGTGWGYSRRMDWSPDEQYVAVAIPPANTVAIGAFTGSSLDVVTYISGTNYQNATDVCWSPDGKYLAIAISKWGYSALEIDELVGDQLIPKARAADVEIDGAHTVTWSPDGRYVAVAAEGPSAGGISIYEFTGTALSRKTYVTKTYTAGSDDWIGMTDMAWSPNGKYLAIPCQLAMEICS